MNQIKSLAGSARRLTVGDKTHAVHERDGDFYRTHCGEILHLPGTVIKLTGVITCAACRAAMKKAT